MAKAPTKYQRGAKVKLRHRQGTHTVSYPMVIPIPSIIKEQFTLVDRVMYKFITAAETYYAWEEDIKA